MSKIPYDQHRGQEIIFLFCFDPDSKYSGILFDGHLVYAIKFKPDFNRAEFFDLSQDPLVLNYDAFEKRWSWFKYCTCDINIIKYPDTKPHPGNPHNIAQVMICLVLQQSRLAVIVDGQLIIRKPEQLPTVGELDYSVHGGLSRPRKSSPIPSKKKEPDLHIVPASKQATLPKVRHDVPPLDVLDKINARHPFPAVLVINAAVFRFSWCGSSKYLYQWHEKEHRDSKWFHRGIMFLVMITGHSVCQVKRALKWLDDNNFIYLIHQGWKGEGYSEYELPKDMTTVDVFIHRKIVKIIRKKRG